MELTRAESNEVDRNTGGLSYADLQKLKSGEAQPVLAKLRRRRKLRAWIPFAFSGFLVVLAFGANLMAGSSGTGGNPAGFVLFAFLPMCFFFVGAALFELQRENDDLREQVEALMPKAHPGSDTA